MSTHTRGGKQASERVFLHPHGRAASKQPSQNTQRNKTGRRLTLPIQFVFAFVVVALLLFSWSWPWSVCTYYIHRTIHTTTTKPAHGEASIPAIDRAAESTPFDRTQTGHRSINSKPTLNRSRRRPNRSIRAGCCGSGPGPWTHEWAKVASARGGSCWKPSLNKAGCEPIDLQIGSLRPCLKR